MPAAGPAPVSPTVVRLLELGRTEYGEALALQQRLHAARVRGESEDVLILTEHERVLTLGRRADGRHLRVPETELASRGIALVQTERGGDITYHGPGQLVAYPILDLRARGCDVRRHVRALEESAIRWLAAYGIDAGRREGAPGVWVGDRKIASIGIYVSRWVTMHGLAINVAPALDDFELIHPCGFVGLRMTSITELCGAAPPTEVAAREYACAFAGVFDVALSTENLDRAAAVRVPAPTTPPPPDRA